MVGVPKSTGCAVCRKRKIKCDETWPICIHCQKNGKRCPGPPSRHTFKDLGPRLSSDDATSIFSSNSTHNIIDPKPYLYAVQILQVSLEDHQQVHSPNTLCAAVLLGVVEAMAGPRAGTRYLTHIRGTMSCVYDRRHCFLAAPEWDDIAFNRADSFSCEGARQELMRLSATLPGFLCDMQDQNEHKMGRTSFNTDIDSVSEPTPLYACAKYDTYSNEPVFIPRMDNTDFVNGVRGSKKLRKALLDKLCRFKQALEDISASVEARTCDGLYKIGTSALTDFSGAPATLDIHHNHAVATFTLAGALLLASNRILMELLPSSEPLYYALEAKSRMKAYEICNTLRAAHDNRTLDSFSMSLSFIMAYEYCTPTMQEWMLEKMNASLMATLWSDKLMHIMHEKFYLGAAYAQVATLYK
ncbi:hypothetical protein DM02DRAFT_590029 [Periconia macrospinosa]|uniref:Zn(2)-C6 fungal-type domain-containing protein n=1 Tax=Periconia macrospinosa TaxID=97972 RepID=A0A2V1DY04_9PLEO|nr:hypothetical protein DM02DRAFT_590029 [Periconia macrospinosa]